MSTHETYLTIPSTKYWGSCFTWRPSEAEVLNALCCHSFGFHALIISLFCWGVYMQSYPQCDVCILSGSHACRHIYASLCPWSCDTHTHTYGHTQESTRRSLGLLQLATGSQDSNNRVASQLQATAEPFPERSQIGGKRVIMGSEIERMITALHSLK